MGRKKKNVMVMMIVLAIVLVIMMVMLEFRGEAEIGHEPTAFEKV